MLGGDGGEFPGVDVVDEHVDSEVAKALLQHCAGSAQVFAEGGDFLLLGSELGVLAALGVGDDGASVGAVVLDAEDDVVEVGLLCWVHPFLFDYRLSTARHAVDIDDFRAEKFDDLV